jgi:hypothetical protein
MPINEPGEILAYDQEGGRLISKVDVANHIKAGTEAGGWKTAKVVDGKRITYR